MPCRSPGRGVALEDFEMRAPTTSRVKFDTFISGAMAIESSSLNVAGNSRAALRIIASGMRGPSAARAKMNTVSVGATLSASAGASFTTPLTPLAATPGSGAAGRALVRSSSSRVSDVVNDGWLHSFQHPREDYLAWQYICERDTLQLLAHIVSGRYSG